VINAIKRLQNQYPEAKIIAIFDAKGKNIRHDICIKSLSLLAINVFIFCLST
jgi:hypothetical protein